MLLRHDRHGGIGPDVRSIVVHPQVLERVGLVYAHRGRPQLRGGAGKLVIPRIYARLRRADRRPRTPRRGSERGTQARVSRVSAYRSPFHAPYLVLHVQSNRNRFRPSIDGLRVREPPRANILRGVNLLTLSGNSGASSVLCRRSSRRTYSPPSYRGEHPYPHTGTTLSKLVPRA